LFLRLGWDGELSLCFVLAEVLFLCKIAVKALREWNFA